MADWEKVIKGLECCRQSKCTVDCPYYPEMNGCGNMLKSDALALLKAQEPRVMAKDEWRTWKKAKNRDPLCYMWRGDDTPFWALKPEDINEPAYFAGQIVIFNGKPTEAQREAVKRV